MEKIRNIKKSLLVVATVMLVSACGSNPGERALTGAGIGAGVGAVGGALMGSPATGAAIGGAVGAATGGLTNENQINLGKPIWRSHSHHPYPN